MFPDGERLIEWHCVVHLSARKMTWGASRLKDRLDVDIKAQNRLRLFHRGCGCIDRFVSCGMLIVTDRRARITKKPGSPRETDLGATSCLLKRKAKYIRSRPGVGCRSAVWTSLRKILQITVAHYTSSSPDMENPVVPCLLFSFPLNNSSLTRRYPKIINRNPLS